MSTQVVAGPTTIDINAAVLAAGIGGTVVFSNSIPEYEADELQATIADQTWIGERNTVIKKKIGSVASCVLEVKAQGLRLQGISLDGNRLNDTAQYQSGLICEGYDLDLRDFKLDACRDWGVFHNDGLLTMIDFNLTQIGYSGIYAYLNPTSLVQKGPHIERGVIDHVIGFSNFGCMAIIGNASKRYAGPRVENVTLLSYNAGAPNNSGGLAIFNSDEAIVQGVETIGGRMGMSFSASHACLINGCTTRQHTSYEIELVNCNGTSVTGNTLRGAAGVTGVENNHSNSTKVSGNAVSGCTPFLRIYQSTGVQHDMLAANVLIQ